MLEITVLMRGKRRHDHLIPYSMAVFSREGFCSNSWIPISGGI
jgi:hypothetical protein